MGEAAEKKAMRKKSACIIATVLFCCAVMALADGVLRPPYAVKSAVKAVLFLLVLAALAVGGVLFDLLDARSGSIFPSWAVHICANLAINAVGVVMFGLI